MKPINHYDLKQWPESYQPNRETEFVDWLKNKGEQVIGTNRFKGLTGAIFFTVETDTCFQEPIDIVSMSLHLENEHQWNHQMVQAWLRIQVQEKAFQEGL